MTHEIGCAAPVVVGRETHGGTKPTCEAVSLLKPRASSSAHWRTTPAAPHVPVSARDRVRVPRCHWSGGCSIDPSWKRVKAPILDRRTGALAPLLHVLVEEDGSDRPRDLQRVLAESVFQACTVRPIPQPLNRRCGGIGGGRRGWLFAWIWGTPRPGWGWACRTSANTDHVWKGDGDTR